MKKLAIVSGGSRGLGAALCRQYAEAGFDLVEFSRSAPHPFSVACDFTDPAQVAQRVAERLAPLAAGQAFDEIVVISNAAMLDPIGPVSRKAPAAVQANLNTSLVSAILFMGETIRAFQKSPAHKTAVSISSGAATKGHAGWSLYCAAKAGLDNFMRALTLEQALEAQPFRALIIDPGIMDTAMQADIRTSSREDFPSAIRAIVAAEHAGGERLIAADFI